jgi:hypothetical protein
MPDKGLLPSQNIRCAGQIQEMISLKLAVSLPHKLQRPELRLHAARRQNSGAENRLSVFSMATSSIF